MQQNSNVLVVGGSGFIGSRLLNHHPDWTNIDWKEGFGIEDHNFLGYDVVVLLAAHLGQTRKDYMKNLGIYSRVVELASREKVKPRVIYTSSAAVYNDIPVANTEQSWTNPKTIYGKSKLLGETIVKDFFENYTILRLSNVYGTGDGHGAIDSFAKGGRVIFGSGSQIRDYIYVENVVDAIGRAVESTDFNRQTYNVSTGKGQTVNQVFETFGTGKPEYAAARDFDVAYSVLVNDKAMQAGLL